MLIKDEVGKQRPATHKLPSQDFRYGKPDIPDAEGVKEIINNWQSSQPEHQEAEKKPDAARVFGKPSRRSTPMADLVKNKFGLQGEREHAKRVAEICQVRVEAKREVQVRPTKASDAHAKRAVAKAEVEVPKEPFKMKKFLRVPPRLVLPGKPHTTN